MKIIGLKDLYYLLVIVMILAGKLFRSPMLKRMLIGFISSFAYHFSRKKRRLMERNLDQAFHHSLSVTERERIVRAAFREFWQDTFLLLPLPEELAQLEAVEISGKENLENAMSRGCGVILWESNGLGRRFASKQILFHHKFKLVQIHGPAHLGGFLEYSPSTWIRGTCILPFFENAEKKFVSKIITIPNSNSLAYTRTLLAQIKQNAILCIAGDGTVGQKLVSIPLMGHPMNFSTGMVSLARSSGATILAMFCLKTRDGKIRLFIEPPIDFDPEEQRESALEKSVAQFVELLEKYIQNYPEQYRNWHLLNAK